MSEAISTASPFDDRFAQGCERFAAVTGSPAQAFLDSLKDSSPDFGRYLMEWVFADLYGRDDLDLKTRELVIIATGAAMGATGIDVIKFHVPNALRAGATREQIFGVLLQVAIVAGIPTALAAVTAAAQALPKAASVAASGAEA
jgi:4-carboxymuconolactone decarboxylase